MRRVKSAAGWGRNLIEKNIGSPPIGRNRANVFVHPPRETEEKGNRSRRKQLSRALLSLPFPPSFLLVKCPTYRSHPRHENFAEGSPRPSFN